MMLEPRADVHASFQQEVDYGGSAKLTGPGETVFHLRGGRVRFQTPAGVEEAFHEIEASHARRAFQIQAGSSTGQEFGGLRPPVGQAAIHCRTPSRAVDGRARVPQCL
jgi:hypothetical protein